MAAVLMDRHHGKTVSPVPNKGPVGRDPGHHQAALVFVVVQGAEAPYFIEGVELAACTVPPRKCFTGNVVGMPGYDRGVVSLLWVVPDHEFIGEPPLPTGVFTHILNPEFVKS